MNYQDKIAKLMELHQPEAINDPMVYEVWEDGEITLTKGGDLYGQRTLHTIEYGVPHRAIPLDEFPGKCLKYRHARIIVKSHDEAQAARNLILE